MASGRIEIGTRKILYLFFEYSNFFSIRYIHFYKKNCKICGCIVDVKKKERVRLEDFKWVKKCSSYVFVQDMCTTYIREG